MSLVANERTKLSARYLNGIAVALFAIAAFALLVTLTGGAGYRPRLVAGIAGGGILASIVLHLTARRLLGRLSA